MRIVLISSDLRRLRQDGQAVINGVLLICDRKVIGRRAKRLNSVNDRSSGVCEQSFQCVTEFIVCSFFEVFLSIVLTGVSRSVLLSMKKKGRNFLKS